MKQWYFLGLIAIAVVILVTPNCGEDTESEVDIMKELAQVWEGERYTRNNTGQTTDHERLYFKLTTEMTYLWAFEHERRVPEPDTVMRNYDEEGTWELNETKDVITLAPDGGTTSTVVFTFAGDTLVISDSKEGAWRMQWTFSSRSDWW